MKVVRKRHVSSRAIFLNDWHVPYHDERALQLAFAFAEWFKPDQIFLVGDLLDFYQVSRYVKDPRRELELEDDLDKGIELLRQLRKRCKKSEIHYLDGNHEDRMNKYLADSPALSQLEALKIPSLLKLDAVSAKHYNYRQSLKWHGLRVEHGNRVRAKSGYTAAAMLDSRGVSGLSGHTHRLGAHYRANCAGTHVWFENGCLCGLEPEYVNGPTDWQHGFSVGYGLKGDGRFLLEQIPVLRDRLFYQGEVFELSGRIKALRVMPPEFHAHQSMDDIAAFLREKEATDKTFEGGMTAASDTR